MILRSKVVGLSNIIEVEKAEKKYRWRTLHCDVSQTVDSGSSSLPIRVFNKACDEYSLGDDIVISLDRYASEILDVVSLDSLL